VLSLFAIMGRHFLLAAASGALMAAAGLIFARALMRGAAQP